MTIAKVFELPRFKQQDKKQRREQQPKEPLPWHEGEPDFPEPPFLPAA